MNITQRNYLKQKVDAIMGRLNSDVQSARAKAIAEILVSAFDENLRANIVEMAHALDAISTDPKGFIDEAMRTWSEQNHPFYTNFPRNYAQDASIYFKGMLNHLGNTVIASLVKSDGLLPDSETAGATIAKVFDEFDNIYKVISQEGNKLKDRIMLDKDADALVKALTDFETMLTSRTNTLLAEYKDKKEAPADIPAPARPKIRRCRREVRKKYSSH